jgi:hypothetical protein
MNEKRMQILLRTRNPQYFHRVKDSGLEYQVALCDQEAIRFLNDIPAPLFVKEIRYLYDPKYLLFSNRWVQGAENPSRKPLTPVEKGVFWAAKATERWTPHVA